MRPPSAAASFRRLAQALKAAEGQSEVRKYLAVQAATKAASDGLALAQQEKEDVALKLAIALHPELKASRGAQGEGA